MGTLSRSTVDVGPLFFCFVLKQHLSPRRVVACLQQPCGGSAVFFCFVLKQRAPFYHKLWHACSPNELSRARFLYQRI